MAHSKYSNIARPYAIAAFDFAKGAKQLPLWKSLMDSAALLASDRSVKQLLANPIVSPATQLSFIVGLIQSIFPALSEEQKNFLHLLSENKRLTLLVEIAELYNEYYADYEKTSIVKVITAIEITDEFKQTLTQALKKREQHDVILQSEIDPSIIGGAIIHIGDKVIDGSVRGKLARLLEFSLR